MFVDTGLTNPIVAADMVPFFDLMQCTGEHLGIAAVVVFALRYRLRVHVWVQDQCLDVVKEYAAWAVGFVNHRPIYDAISCKVSPQGLSLHDHNVRRLGGCDWVCSGGFQHG